MRIVIVAFAAFAVLSAPSFAHPGHDDDMEDSLTPEKAAHDAVIRLVTQAKLSASWSKATLVEVKERTKDGIRQTVATFRNDAEPDKSRQLLYVVMDADGAVASARHSR